MGRINTATLALALGAEPERKPQVGTSGLVSARCYMLQGRDKPSLWIEVLAWSQFTQTDLGGLHKGDRVLVTGRLAMNEYKTKDGETRQQLQLVAENVDPGAHDRGAETQQKPAPQRPPMRREPDPIPPPDDDTIPF